MRSLLLRCLGVLLLAIPCARAATLRHEVLDDFSNVSAWQASASDQVHASLRRDTDGSLCLDYDFAGVSGYAVMRRALPVHWPEAFDLHASLKRSGGVNDLQIKFVDASGDNVWWIHRANAALPTTLSSFTFRRRHVEFAWGPTADRRLRETQFIELVVVAGRDRGRGSLCAARLALDERAPDPAQWPAPRTRRSAHRLDLDFGASREFNGVALRWPVSARPLDYDLLASDDERRWRTLRRVRGSDGGLDALFLPDSEARHLRVAVLRGAGLPQLTLRSATEWPTLDAMLATQAAAAPRGDLPRAYRGEQNYWTLVGVDGGGAHSALMSEDGAIEVGRGGFSVEPVVLLDDGSRVTWADATLTQTLRDGDLPLPAVHWQHPAFQLEIEAAADGDRAHPELLARYVLRNTGPRERRFTLLLAVRPWQVNPPQQFLGTPGGASPIRDLAWDGRTLTVNTASPLMPSSRPQRVGALPFDGGVSLQALRAAPPLRQLSDPQGLASAALQWRVTLPAGASMSLGWTAPLAARDTLSPATTAGQLDARFDAAAARWRGRLARVRFDVPAEAQPLVHTLRSTLAQILMSRDGAALQPGTRSYARTWIRDGAMMVAGLVRLGEVDAAREFVDWFAGRIFDSGKVPCCVDARGADPVVENDSHGEYLFAVAEVWRHTHDRAFLERHWPRVQRVVAYQESLRQQERGEANRRPERARLFGLMPPSISHEGYSDKPAYSYWDDFWALRGYKDAVTMATELRHDAEAARWSVWRDEFAHELAQSIAATAQHYRTGVIAGAADRGDFDPTSTTMALNPAQADVPQALLDATFERYWQESLARAQGRRASPDYTPYELRSVGALVRLGQPARARAMLDFFMGDCRPAGWNQWAEVVLPDARKVHFLGDMPHAWISSDYIRSVLDFFAFERESDDSLVLGAGLDPAWLRQGVQVQGLSTSHGRLDWQLAPAPQGWFLRVPTVLDGLRGGLRLAWPGEGPLPRALQDGHALAWRGRELTLPAPPLRIDLIAE